MPVSEIADDELLRRAVANARPLKAGVWPRWAAVMDTFLLGSTYAQELCERFDLNPHELIKHR
jgi:hypothetical protein